MPRLPIDRKFRAYGSLNTLLAHDSLTEVGANWTYWSGGGTLSLASGQGENGEDVISCTRPQGQTLSRFYVQPSPALDWSGYKGIGFKVKFPTLTTSNSHLLYITLYIQSSSGNYYRLTYGGGKYREGWCAIHAKWSDMVASGTPDLTNITQIYYYIQTSVGTEATDTVLFGGICEWRGARTVGMFVFDDANATDYTYVYPEATSRNIKINHAIYTNSYVDDSERIGLSGVLSISQMNEMYATGRHQFCNHTRNGNDLTVLSDTDKLYQITYVRDYIKGRWPGGENCLIYPGGQINKDVVQAAKACGCILGRAADGEYPTFANFIPSGNLGTIDWFNMPIIDISKRNTLQDIKDAIDDAIIAQVAGFIIMGHRIDEVSTDPPGVGATAVNVTTLQGVMDHFALRKSQGYLTDMFLSEFYNSMISV